MTDPKHDDIIRRVDAVERTQQSMQAQIVQIGRQAERAAEAATDNRKHFDDQMSGLRDEVTSGHKHLGDLIAEHRSEFKTLQGQIGGGVAVIKFGLPLGMMILIAVVGWALM
jgi:hypothetical protein